MRLDPLGKPCGLLAPALLLLTTGCASQPADRSLAGLRSYLSDRGRPLGEQPNPDALAAKLLTQPLNAEDTVQVTAAEESTIAR